MPKSYALEVAVNISYLNLALPKFLQPRETINFGFSFWNSILNTVNAKRERPEGPVSKVMLCWNRLGRFVSIRFFETCWSLIKLLRQFMSQNFFIEFPSIPSLKSPMKKKLSYVLLCSSMTWLKYSRWLEIEILWGLYEQFKNHFLFFKLIWTERFSILHWDLDCNKRDGMASLIHNRRPPLLSFYHSYL